MFFSGIYQNKLKSDEVFALHEALMLLQHLVKSGFIEFDKDEGIAIKTKGAEE